MAPTLVREPFHRPGWVFEEKVDGWSILAYKGHQRVRLVSATASNTRAASLAVALVLLASVVLVVGGGCASLNTLPRCKDVGLGQLKPNDENVYYDARWGGYIYCAGYGGRCVPGGMSCIVGSQ